MLRGSGLYALGVPLFANYLCELLKHDDIQATPYHENVMIAAK